MGITILRRITLGKWLPILASDGRKGVVVVISILRGHMPPALVVTAVTLVLGVLNFGVSFYSATYPGNVDLGKSFNYSLSAGQSSKVNISPATRTAF